MTNIFVRRMYDISRYERIKSDRVHCYFEGDLEDNTYGNWDAAFTRE